jgi:hypothetical protein
MPCIHSIKRRHRKGLDIHEPSTLLEQEASRLPALLLATSREAESEGM